jgi:hypothetical protein
MEWRSLSTAAIRKLARQSRTYQRYRSMAVFHVSILGQTYETLQALVFIGWHSCVKSYRLCDELADIPKCTLRVTMSTLGDSSCLL